jgi:pyochelin synthetase
MEKGWEQIAAVLGILASGAAYVPIDPDLPQERREYLLNNSEVNFVLTQSWLRDRISFPEKIVRLCIDDRDLENESKEPLEPIQTPDDLAYLIYTSGSTGVPKGVMINHRGAVNTIVDINQRFKVSHSDRVLALSSLSFDLSVYDIFGTLAAGGTIVIPETSGDREPSHWAELIDRHKVTIWNSVPALMQMMVDYVEEGRRQKVYPALRGTEGRSFSSHRFLKDDKDRVLENLRLVLLSGDWLPLTLANQIKTLGENIEVVSLGGATEASIWSILYPIEAVDPGWTSIPYGCPMANQRFYVLNESLEACPTWVSGQLYIGGIGLAMGYWQQEAKTAASFITHPLTNERLYRTGDLGRYLPDGNIEFLGREDFQVKIGGYRIELGEIESVLTRHPDVDKVVVTVAGKDAIDKRLVAYVVGDREISCHELRCFLREHLPEYMIPSAFMYLENLPLSANGKVDRRALPNPEILLREIEVTYVAPQNEIEQAIADVWKRVLDLEKVGIDNNFFEIGGNSLLITKVYSKLLNTLGDRVEFVSLIELFKYPTISSLAQYLSKVQSIESSNLSSSQLVDRLAAGKNRLKERRQRSKVIEKSQS